MKTLKISSSSLSHQNCHLCISSSLIPSSTDDNPKPSYSELAKIVIKQQKVLEKVQNLLDKSDDLLGEEFNRLRL